MPDTRFAMTKHVEMMLQALVEPLSQHLLA
jgi:hypothetical protein